MRFQKAEHKKGFSMAETLVAIAVLVIAVGGPITLAWQSLRLSSLSSDEIIAFNLAVEGIEHARKLRDGNYLLEIRDDPNPDPNWLTGLGPCLSGTHPEGCGTQVNSNGGINTIDCLSSGCPPLTIEEVTADLSLYNYNGTEVSPYTRVVRITERIDEVEADVESTVTWETRSGTRTISVDATLFNWLKPSI